MVEGVVDFYKVEHFGVGFKRRLIWGFEVGPAAGANQVAFAFVDGTNIGPGEGHMSKLVVTIGLAVAIPALFGYNWLAAQIKNVTADMSVFADEFITKAAELHSR